MTGKAFDDIARARPDDAEGLLRMVWASVGDSAGEERAIVAEMLRSEGTAAQANRAAALVPREAVSLGVLSEQNLVLHQRGLFASWFPDPGASLDLRRLAAEARAGRPSIRLLETAAGGVVVAWAGSGEVAAKWAADPATLQALAGRGRVLVVVFAPTRSSDLAARAAEAFDLSPLESRLAEAFLFAPSLEIAATQVGIGRETARDALESAMRKMGVRRSTDVVRRLAGLMGDFDEAMAATPDMLVEAFGITPAEAGVALRIAAGLTHREAAEALGLQPETVRGYAKSVLAKAGVGRAKDLARLVAETQALSHLVSVAEPVFTSGAPLARLRLMPRPDGRRLAFLDYGPLSGRPAFISHGFVAGRSLPPALARALHARGLRPLVLQRPGFGLTSPPTGGTCYLETASADLAALILALRLDQITLFARDGGVAAALDFAHRRPDLVGAAVLLNPRPPKGLAKGYRGKPVATMTRLILAQPHLISGVGEFIRRRTRSDFLETALRQTLPLPQDQAALADPAIRDQLIRDIQAQFAHSSAGYAAEHGLYAEGWRVPAIAAGTWTILHSQALGADPPRTPWLGLPAVTFRTIPDAGVLTQFTHPDALANAIAGVAD